LKNHERALNRSVRVHPANSEGKAMADMTGIEQEVQINEGTKHAIESSVKQALNEALTLHRAGRLAEAERLYRQILGIDPCHAHSLHLLGVIAHQCGRHAEALDMISKAIALNDRVADFHCNMGIVLFALGRLQEAVAHYARAITLEPGHVLSYNNFGNALIELGRPQEAEARLRRAIELKPDYAETHYSLGNILRMTARYEEAIAHYKQSVAGRPDFADAWNNMGAALVERGDFDAARDAFQKAVELDPTRVVYHKNLALTKRFKSDDPQLAVMEELARNVSVPEREQIDLQFALGKAYADLKQHDRSFQHLRRAIELKPDYAEAHYTLGYALAEQGKLDDAVVYYRRALALAPNANGHNNLGTTLEKQNKLDDAAAQFRRALELEPQHATAHYNLGNNLRVKGRYEEAIAHFKQSIAGRPDSADAWNNMGIALAEHGNLDEARDAYQKAVELDPTRVVHHKNLAHTKRFKSDDPQLAVMEELARNLVSVPEHEQIDLQFALGKAYADLKQHDRSFQHLLAGNTLKRAQIGYSEVEALGYMQRIRTVFNAELLNAKAGGGDNARTPVFIVGMPRSGTTLIEQIIASHPKAFGAGELFDLNNIVQSLVGVNGSVRFPEAVATMSGEELRQVGTRYVTAISALAPAADRVADKMPGNFYFVGLIHLALPNARIIHARRDPVDTCLSCFSILFVDDSNRYTYDLAELGRFYRAYDSLMAHWRTVLPPGVMIEVQYEEVVDELEKQARQIIAHCGLEWDDTCLAFHKTRRPVRTSSFAQVRQPIYNSSVGRWRAYRNHLRPLLDALGFDPKSDPAAASSASPVAAAANLQDGSSNAASIEATCNPIAPNEQGGSLDIARTSPTGD
jgi:tetratricopeptide (TPR) repeat protein